MARTTKSFSEVLRKKRAADPELAAAIADERFNINVGAEIYRVRTEAKLTQGQLADKVGTHQSVIARLEDADYDGHSLAMLKRIGDALGMTLRVEFRPRSAEWRSAASSCGTSELRWGEKLDWKPAIKVSGTSAISEQPYGFAA